MFRAFAGAAVLFATVSSPVHAGPIVDVVDPVNVFVSSDATPACPSAEWTCGVGTLTFVHDITDDGFQIGDIIGSAHIDIRLAELVATGANLETYRYTLGSQTLECLQGNCVPDPGVLDTISLVAGLPDLADDGKISITLSALSGSFYFASSELTAEVSRTIQVLTEIEPSDPRTAAVPVPSTLLLLGAGLMALRFRLRRHAET